MAVNYAEEAKLLSNGFWRPPAGETLVTALSELSDKQEMSYGGQDGGEPELQEKVDLDVEIDSRRHTWRITVQPSQQSLYGQLVTLAHEQGGLAGLTLCVTRQGTGRGTRYSVTPASR